MAQSTLNSYSGATNLPLLCEPNNTNHTITVTLGDKDGRFTSSFNAIVSIIYCVE